MHVHHVSWKCFKFIFISLSSEVFLALLPLQNRWYMSDVDKFRIILCFPNCILANHSLPARDVPSSKYHSSLYQHCWTLNQNKRELWSTHYPCSHNLLCSQLKMSGMAGKRAVHSGIAQLLAALWIHGRRGTGFCFFQVLLWYGSSLISSLLGLVSSQSKPLTSQDMMLSLWEAHTTADVQSFAGK